MNTIKKGNRTLLIGTRIVQQVSGGTSGGVMDLFGFARIMGVSVPMGSFGNAVYLDPPGNTMLSSVEVSSGSFDVLVESSFPNVMVNGVAAVLPLVGSIYSGAVSVVLAVDGPILATTIKPDGNPGGSHEVQVVLLQRSTQLYVFLVFLKKSGLYQAAFLHLEFSHLHS